MVFLGVIGSGMGGGGGNRIGKPRGKTMRQVNPLTVLGADERETLAAKQGILREITSLGAFEHAKNLEQLTAEVKDYAGRLFPRMGLLLLAKRPSDYAVIAQERIDFKPEDLKLSVGNSIVRVAGESVPSERRTIYLPDLNQQTIYLGSKFDRAFGSELAVDQHMIEEGTIEESGLAFDLFSLKRAGVAALAVAPILEYKAEPPVGAVMLFGERAFLNPMVDLLVLRDFADLIARPLKIKLA